MSEGPKGDGDFGEGQPSHPHQLGSLGERRKLPPVGFGAELRAPNSFAVF